MKTRILVYSLSLDNPQGRGNTACSYFPPLPLTIPFFFLMIPLYYTQPTTVLDCLDAILFSAIGRSLFTRDHLFCLYTYFTSY